MHLYLTRERLEKKPIKIETNKIFKETYLPNILERKIFLSDPETIIEFLNENHEKDYLNPKNEEHFHAAQITLLNILILQ